MIRHVVIVFVAVAGPGHGGGIGRGGGRASAPIALACLRPDPCRGLLNLGELFNEFVQFRLRAEAEAIDCVGPDIGPLSELLTRLCECHVRGDGGVDDCLGPLHGNDPVEGAGGVIEEGHGHRCTGGGYPRAFSLRVNVENMCLAREDRLLTWKNMNCLNLCKMKISDSPIVVGWMVICEGCINFSNPISLTSVHYLLLATNPYYCVAKSNNPLNKML